MSETPFGPNELLHPFSYDGHEQAVVPPVEAYLPFIHTQVSEDAVRLENLVRTLYVQDGEMWKPRNCRHSLTLQELVAASRASDSDTLIAQTQLKSYRQGGHYFMTVQFDPEGRELIFDPFGVPASESRDDDRHIVPFFGDSALAPESARAVYDEAETIPPGTYNDPAWATRAR